MDIVRFHEVAAAQFKKIYNKPSQYTRKSFMWNESVAAAVKI
jgi:hypothetical protein